MTRRDERQSGSFYDLSTLILNLLRYPPTPTPTPISFSDHYSPSSINRPLPLNSMPPMSAAGFASLLLGVSLALMLCGSVTFIIGFMLMPWVVGLLAVLYVVGVVSSLSILGSAICSHFLPPPPPFPTTKEVPEWKMY
ncbi:uncharacterized protein LOC124921091 [Impatiens glandulifera]|uniref:uncharacterized protein LOC124921091 n=1 Tax=Impatiens glandulifera TaxID=253017 RepID=UPI001FB192A8|nr:uncharacterized protein LOC124921091 [Impatiens glandulifera]